MPRTLIKPVILLIVVLGLLAGAFLLFFNFDSSASEAQPDLVSEVIKVGGNEVEVCLDPRLDSREKGLVNFGQLSGAQVQAFEGLVGTEIRLFSPELPPVQYNMTRERAGKKCGTGRPENSEVYVMGAGDFPHSGQYKAYAVDGVVQRIEGFYSNAENSPSYQEWKSQQDG